MYIEIGKDACGALQLLTSFDLINHVFVYTREPYNAKAHFLAHKCSCDEWHDAYNRCIHTWKKDYEVIHKVAKIGFAKKVLQHGKKTWKFQR
jgi:hypothetical protein